MKALQPRVAVFVAIAVVVVGGVGVDVWFAARSQHAASIAAPSVASTSTDSVLAGPHILFRSTLPGDGYGMVAAVPLDNPSGARAFTTVACDALSHRGDDTVCLRTVRGVATTYEAVLLDPTWHPVRTWPLPGMPSRARLSDDGTLVATTAFIANHCSTQVHPPTETRIHGIDGTDLGNLESWTLLVDGATSTAADRNFWDVSFVDDDHFYVAVGLLSTGTTWIATGTVSTRTISTVREGADSPAVSPDGSELAYRKAVRVQDGRQVYAYAVLDVASGSETVFPATEGGTDQAEWLDDSTILYTAPRSDQPGTTDVWSLHTASADAKPALLISGASSPTVVTSAGSAHRSDTPSSSASPSSARS